MRILTVLTYYYPHWTGLTAYAMRVAEGLASRGHQVTVLCSRHEQDLPLDEMVNGVRVVRLRPLARFSRGMVTPGLLWALLRFIPQHDLVQIHTPLPEGPLVAALARLLRRPLLMTHHGDLVMPAGAINRAIEWLGFQVLLTTANLADGVTSHSRDYARNSKLLRGVRHKLHYIHSPVDLPQPDPRTAAEWKRELGLQDKVLIGFSGRWVHEKGFDYLLQAIPHIRRSIPEAHLVFAGEVDVVYEDFYEQCLPLIEQNREHITFLGLLKGAQRMADFYHMCDLFVLPSRTDMMPFVQVEAMLAGTPVVATDIPGARVVIQDTGFGQLAPPHDPEGIARTIVDTLNQKERYRPTREGVRAVFNTEKTLTAFEGAMKQLVARRQGLSVAERLPAEVGTPAVIRYRDGEHGDSHLDPRDQEILRHIIDKEPDMAYRRRARVLLDYMELRDGHRVLDCGCGMGFYLMVINRLRDAEVYGIDSWMDRLRWGQREQVGGGLVRGEVTELPFAAETFDSVLLSEVLEHLPDERFGLREIHRVLRPGGVLAISVPHANYPPLWDPINYLWTGLGGPPIRKGPLVGIWTNHERLYWPEELAARVQEAGLEVEIVEEATHYSFPFSHFLVYGLGKPLLERGLLPRPLRDRADRLRVDEDNSSFLNPINLAVAAFRQVDRKNERPDIEEARTFVNVLLKARKPTARV